MRRSPLTSAVALSAAVCFAHACRAPAEQPRAEPPSPLTVRVRAPQLSAPDTVAAGWTTVHVDDAGERHIVVLFRLGDGDTRVDAPAFAAALDSAPATPSAAVAVGGPELGSRGDVMLRLTPGTYAVACVRRGDDGHRHATAGEVAVMHVRAQEAAMALTDSAPTASLRLALGDFAYVGPDTWRAGAHLLRLENTGHQDHQLRLERLNAGVTASQWLAAEDPSTLAVPVAGMARLGAGEVAYLPLTLASGDYVAYCLVTDPVSRKPHIELGMVRVLYVR